MATLRRPFGSTVLSGAGGRANVNRSTTGVSAEIVNVEPSTISSARPMLEYVRIAIISSLMCGERFLVYDAAERFPEGSAALGRIDSNLKLRWIVRKRCDADAQPLKGPGEPRIARITAVGLLDGNRQIAPDIGAFLDGTERQLDPLDRRRARDGVFFFVDDFSAHRQRGIAR